MVGKNQTFASFELSNIIWRFAYATDENGRLSQWNKLKKLVDENQATLSLRQINALWIGALKDRGIPFFDRVWAFIGDQNEKLSGKLSSRIADNASRTLSNVIRACPQRFRLYGRKVLSKDMAYEDLLNKVAYRYDDFILGLRSGALPRQPFKRAVDDFLCLQAEPDSPVRRIARANLINVAQVREDLIEPAVDEIVHRVSNLTGPEERQVERTLRAIEIFAETSMTGFVTQTNLHSIEKWAELPSSSPVLRARINGLSRKLKSNGLLLYAR